MFPNDQVLASGVDDVFDRSVFVAWTHEEQCRVAADALVGLDRDAQPFDTIDPVALADDVQWLMLGQRERLLERRHALVHLPEDGFVHGSTARGVGHLLRKLLPTRLRYKLGAPGTGRGLALLETRKFVLVMGEIVSLHDYAARKLRRERVAVNEAALRDVWDREEVRLQWQYLWRSHPKRRRPGSH